VFYNGLMSRRQRPSISRDPALELAGAFLTGARTDPRSLPWHSLTLHDLSVIRAWAAESFSAEVCSGVLRAVRWSVMAPREGAQDFEERPQPRRLQDATRSRTRLVGRRSLSNRSIAALLDMCRLETGAAGARDAAVLSLMLTGRFSASRISSLTIGDYDEGAGLITSRPAAARLIRRALALDEGGSALMKDWLAVRGAGRGPLFLPCLAVHLIPAFRHRASAGW
jgi:hypothetical protein